MKYLIFIFSLVFISCNKTPTEIPIGSENNVEAIVTFTVNMSQLDINSFNPDLDLLFVAGEFNDWCLSSCDQLILMNDQEYEISFTNLTNSFFQLDTEFQYKFRINEDDWETPDPAISNCTPDEYGGHNRFHIVVAGENPLQWYFNDESGK